jgi:hypothetical protein
MNSSVAFDILIALAIIFLPVLVWVTTRASRARDGRSVGQLNTVILDESLRLNAILERSIENFDARLAAMEAKLERLEQSRVAIAPPRDQSASTQQAPAAPASSGLRPEELNAGNDD